MCSRNPPCVNEIISVKIGLCIRIPIAFPPLVLVRAYGLVLNIGKSRNSHIAVYVGRVKVSGIYTNSVAVPSFQDLLVRAPGYTISVNPTTLTQLRTIVRSIK